jgi:hypothetical protein
MKKSSLFGLFFALVLFSSFAHGQKRIVFLDSPNNGYSDYADIAEGETATVMRLFNTNSYTHAYLHYKSDTVADRAISSNEAWSWASSRSGFESLTHMQVVRPIIPGPCQLRVRAVSGTTSAILMITSDGATSGSSAKYATVIPENSQTNVNVILEQSTDLVTWTTVVPGEFPPNASKRFFRVRSANVPVAVTAATNASPIVLTSTGHSLNTGDVISVSGVVGNTAANGVFTVTKVDANTFSLNGSTGNGAYVSGGTWLPNP